MISLLRSIISSARSRNSRAFFCAYSLPSSALDARYSRVSSPDLGANRMPSNVPTPSPTRKKLTLEPTLLSLTAHLQYEANMAVARRQLFTRPPASLPALFPAEAQNSARLASRRATVSQVRDNLLGLLAIHHARDFFDAEFS